jgi:hypothetical protein
MENVNTTAEMNEVSCSSLFMHPTASPALFNSIPLSLWSVSRAKKTKYKKRDTEFLIVHFVGC